MPKAPKRANGDGSIYPRKDGRWVAAALAPDGRRRSRYTRSPKAAKRALADLLAELHAGLTPEPGLATGRYLAGWLEDARPRVRPTTWVAYENHVRIHLASIARIPLARIAPADIRRLARQLEEAGLSSSTIRGILTTLRMALRVAVSDGLIARNVAEHVAGPKVERREVAIWQPDEVRRFLAATADRPLGPLWALLVGTGLRLGEALGLQAADVDLAAATLHVGAALRPLPAWARNGAPRLALLPPKTAAGRRTVGLPRFVVDALAGHIDRGFLFTSPTGRPLDPRAALRAFKADIALAGVPDARIHDLRHVAASLLLAQGMTLDDVKRSLGHASIVMTSDLYAHQVVGRADEIAAAMDRAVAVTVAVSRTSTAAS